MKKRNDRHNLIYDMTILAEILAILACLFLLYMHSPAQQYKMTLRLAERYLNEMNYDEAVILFRKAIQIDPKKEKAYIGLGQTYTEKADSLANSENTKLPEVVAVYNQAADAYQKVIDLNKKNADGFDYQAAVYRKAGDAVKVEHAELADLYYKKADHVYQQAQILENSGESTEEVTALSGSEETETESDTEKSGMESSVTDSVAESSTVDTEAEDGATDGSEENGTAVRVNKLSITLVPHNRLRGEFYDPDTTHVTDATIYSEAYSEIRIDTEGFVALKNAVQSFNETTKENADQAYADMRPDSEDGVRYQEDIDVLRADAKVLSFVDDVNQGSMSSSKFHNFDSETGENVALDEVVTDPGELPSLLMNAIPYDTEVESLTESGIALSIADGSLNWGIGYDGLHVILEDQRTGADGSAWTNQIEAAIRFEDEPDLFTDTFQSLPSSYGMPLESNLTYTLTFASDARTHTVEVKPDPLNEDGVIENVTYVLDGAERSLDQIGPCYQIQSYYLHLENGRDFLYLNRTTDNGITTTRVIWLYGEVKVYTDLACSVDGDALGDDRYLEDPSHFLMVHRANIFGTHYLYRYCQVGDGGLPGEIDALYDCRKDPLLSLLRAKTDVPVQILDAPGGSVTGSGTISEGTELYFQKTDGSSFVDFMTSDGKAVRIGSDTSAYPHTTNGIDEGQLFYGISYAG